MHMTGKEKCNKLKKIRATLASKLGIDLHQVECTFEGECTGTCPKCKQEENILNTAILHKGTAVAGAMMLATSITACNPFKNNNTNNTTDTDIEYLTGEVALEPDPEPSTNPDDIEFLTGDVDDSSIYCNTDDTQTDENIDTKTDGNKTIEIVQDLTGYMPPEEYLP